MPSSASRVSGVALILACLCQTAVASKDDNRHSWSTDYIILLVVGLVLIVLVLACWLWCCCCRRRTTETTTATEDVAPVVVSRGGVEPDAGSRLTAVVPGGSEDGNSTVSRKSSKTHQWTTVDEGGNDHEDVRPSVGTEETPIEPLNPLAAPPPDASGKKSSVKLHSTPTATTTTTAVSSGNTNATNEVELTSVEAFPQLHMAAAAPSDGDAQPQPPIVSKEAAPPTAPREEAEAAPPKSRDDAVVEGTSDTTAEASTAGGSQKSAASKKSGVKLRSVPTVTSTTKTTTTAVVLDASEEAVPPPPPTAAQTDVGETAPPAGGDGATSNATPGKKSGVKLRSVPRPAGSNPGDSPPPPPQASA